MSPLTQDREAVKRPLQDGLEDVELREVLGEIGGDVAARPQDRCGRPARSGAPTSGVASNVVAVVELQPVHRIEPGHLDLGVERPAAGVEDLAQHLGIEKEGRAVVEGEAVLREGRRATADPVRRARAP